MNIGFDLDRIFINTPPFIPSWLIDKMYKEKDNGLLMYRIPGKFEQQIRILSHAPILRPSILKNISFLKTLAENKDHTLYLISSRFGFLRKPTEKLTKKYGFGNIFKHMYFNYFNEQPHAFKNKIIKEVTIDRYIDDDLSLLTFLAKENPQTKFYWLNSTQDKKILTNLFAISKITALLD